MFRICFLASFPEDFTVFHFTHVVESCFDKFTRFFYIVRQCMTYGSELGDPDYDVNYDIDGDDDIDVYDIAISAR